MYTIRSSHIDAVLNPMGGFLTIDRVRLADGRIIRPMLINDWAGRPENADLPVVTRHMSSEWVCVPHGAPSAPQGLPARWPRTESHPALKELHGYCANHEWMIAGAGSENISLFIDYPLDHPVRRVERRIELDGTKIIFDLTVVSREDTRLAIGVHPVFHLSATAYQTSVLATFEKGFVFPIDFIPGVSRLLPDGEFRSLGEVPLKEGATLDMTRIPFDFKTDEVVLLGNSDGVVSIGNSQERYTAVVRWDSRAFPSCLLWYANGGRNSPPFNGQLYGLGIEPVANAFGIGTPMSANPDNPIAKQGVRTCVALQKDIPWTTQYTIEFN